MSSHQRIPAPLARWIESKQNASDSVATPFATDEWAAQVRPVDVRLLANNAATRELLQTNSCAIEDPTRTKAASCAQTVASGYTSVLRRSNQESTFSIDDGISEPLIASRSESFREFLSCHARSLGRQLKLGKSTTEVDPSSVRTYQQISIAPAPQYGGGLTSLAGGPNVRHHTTRSIDRSSAAVSQDPWESARRHELERRRRAQRELDFAYQAQATKARIRELRTCSGAMMNGMRMPTVSAEIPSAELSQAMNELRIS